jgi:O-antigen ligase
MSPAVPVGNRRQALIGVSLGLYAAVVSMAPGTSTKLLLCAPLAIVPLFWAIAGSSNAWLALLLATALLAPPLPIALGDSGPHPAILFAAVGLFAGLLRIREWRFRADPLVISLLLLFAVMLASVATAGLYSDLAIAGASLVRVLLFGICVFVFLYVRDGPGLRNPASGLRFIRLLFCIGVLSALFACVDFYFQFPAPAGYGPQFIWLESGVFRRAQGVFYEASTLGNLCAFFLVMIAVALLRPREDQPLSRFALLTGGAIIAVALVLSYSRASLLNLGVALAALLWMHRRRIRWRRITVGAVLFGAGAAAILSAAFPVFASAYWSRINVAFQYFFEAPNTALSGRLESWRFLLDFLASNPWHAILGVGYKTLPYSDFIGAKVIADNTYLSMLAETGIAGLAALLALNATILIVAYRASKSEDRLRSFCGAWIFCFWAGQTVQMTSADLLTYWRVLPAYFLVLALSARREALQ